MNRIRKVEMQFPPNLVVAKSQPLTKTPIWKGEHKHVHASSAASFQTAASTTSQYSWKGLEEIFVMPHGSSYS